MAHSLKGKKVAAIVAKGFEQVELTDPRAALEAAGATVHVISPQGGRVRGWNHTDWGQEVEVDRVLSDVRADDYDALLVPGGVMSPDHLRMVPEAVQLTRAFFEQGKPIASICHGPWLLAEAGVLRGAKVTSYPSLQTDLRNAGADWSDTAVVVDRGMVTSRKPDDLEIFNAKTIEEIAEGRHGSEGHRAPARAAGSAR